MKAPTPLSAEEARRRRGRNLVTALALGGFVALIFAGSLVKMGEGHFPVLNPNIGVSR